MHSDLHTSLQSGLCKLNDMVQRTDLHQDRQAERPPVRAESEGSSVRTRSSRAGTVTSYQDVGDFEITDGAGVESNADDADDGPVETTAIELVALDPSGDGAG